MQFDQATIHNIAAEMFWRMADDYGVAQVNERVLATEGRCLLEHRFDADLWREFPLQSLPDGEATRVLNAVAFEAFDYTRDQQNMIGQVYLEDRQTGRSHSARDIDTRPLHKVPAFISTRPIERLGRLCLRHPLPAVVLADRTPDAQVVQVEDTATALGYDMPMFLSLTGVQQVEDGTFLLVGYFFIPVPDRETGSLWNQVIQNSIRNVESTTLISPDGEWEVRYKWPIQPKGLSAWWRRART